MPVTSTVPTVALDPASTYTTASNSSVVTINTTGGVNHFTNGEVVYLSTPPAGPVGGTYDGIPPASLGGYFTISGVTATSFQITTNTAATTGGITYGVASQTAAPPYATAAAGATARTVGNGMISGDISGSGAASYFNVTATVGVDDGTGNIKTSQITYRVNNNQPAALGVLTGAQAASGSAKLVQPTNYQPLAVAKLVDANGVELPKVNGQYVSTTSGYLEILASNPANNIAINSLNSKEQGKPNLSPAIAGTNQGFSSYFALNNFFNSNKPTATGDTVAGSAGKLSVEQRIVTNNSLMSLGQLTQGSISATAGSPPNYTYQLNPGDNSVITNLAGIAAQQVVFAAAGGLGTTTQTLAGYLGQVIGGIAHGIGNACLEWMRFDEAGQPLTTTLADYLLVSATEMPPRIDIVHLESPTYLNELGIKGVGESGVIPMSAAIASAIDHALEPFGVTVRNVPVTPPDLVALMEENSRP